MKTLVALLTLISLQARAQDALVGKWKTIDDETKEAKSIIDITQSKDGVISGTIDRLFRKPSEDQTPKCEKCTGEKKDKPVIGMTILTGLKKDSETEWSGGEILDPKNGKTYSCKVELLEKGAKLKVRGYIGFSLLGRTQIWEREPAR